MIEYTEENKAYFILSVTDMEKAKEFYKDIFGFEVRVCCLCCGI